MSGAPRQRLQSASGTEVSARSEYRLRTRTGAVYTGVVSVHTNSPTFEKSLFWTVCGTLSRCHRAPARVPAAGRARSVAHDELLIQNPASLVYTVRAPVVLEGETC